MTSPPPPPPPGGRDRLSDLPDFLLGHVLSFLPNKEAGRAAALARRWRDVFCNVQTISFGEHEGQRARDWFTFYHEAEEKKSCSAVLLNGVWSALLCRRRCAAGHHVPVRRFSFAFDDCHHWNFAHVDQWLAYVLQHSNQELHLDLRFLLGPICPGYGGNDGRGNGAAEVDSGTDNSDDDDEYEKMRRERTYVLPGRVFTCRVIRTLRVSYCRLKLPAAVNLPLLETLSITAPHYDGGRSVQRLISSCPRLIDLTLEAIPRLKRVSVLDKQLRRFSVLCCHNMKSADIDAAELRSLDYGGMVPAESVLSLHGSPGVPCCTVDICKALSQEAEFAGFRGFMDKISGAKYLYLHHQSLESRFFLGFPYFSSLTRLVLQGPLRGCGTVVSVGRILEQTPNLEVLSLYMEAYTHKVDTIREEYKDAAVNVENVMDEESEDWFVAPAESGFSEHEDDVEEEEEEESEDLFVANDESSISEYENDVVEKEKDAESDDLFVPPDEFTVPDESSFSMPCLRHRVKEINMVHYVGDEIQRMMARLLLRNALVLEKMCIVLVKGTFALQSDLKNEIDSWVVADAQKLYL